MATRSAMGSSSRWTSSPAESADPAASARPRAHPARAADPEPASEPRNPTALTLPAEGEPTSRRTPRKRARGLPVRSSPVSTERSLRSTLETLHAAHEVAPVAAGRSRRSAPFVRKPVLQELEARLLLSADLNPAAQDTLLATPALQGAEFRALTDIAAPTVVTSAQVAPIQRTHELVFVDTATPEYEQLVEAMRAAAQGEGIQLEFVLIDAERDGIRKITDTLAQKPGLDAIHIVSHASDGAVQLGSTQLDFETLVKRAASIKKWGDALTENGDILFYGCDLAATGEGQSLMQAVARLTGADVAASEDPTGAAAKGGDWELEFRTGAIEAEVAVSAAAQAQWDGLLVRGVSVGAGGTTTEAGGTHTISVVLTGLAGEAPTSNVAIPISVTDSTEGTVSTTTLAFTPGNWNVAQTVTVTGRDDSQPDGDIGYTVVLGAAASADLAWNGINPADRAMTNTDNDRVQSNVVALYTFETNTGATINDVAGANLALTINDTGNVTWAPGSLTVNINQAGVDPTIAETAAGVNEVYTRIAAAQQFSVETWIESSTALQNDSSPHRLVTLSLNTAPDRNFTLGMYDSDESPAMAYVGRVRTDGTDLNGSNSPVNTPAGTATLGLQHVVMTVDPAGNRTIFVNGTPQGTVTVPVNYATWNANYALALFNEVTRDRAWLGTMHMTAIYDRALGTAEVQRNFAAGADIHTLVVDTMSDASDGDVSSIEALLNDRGADGFISLREAILATNATANAGTPDRILFNIAGAGVHTIGVGAALPAITEAVVIDATSEPDFAGVPMVRIDGSSAGFARGLEISSGGSTVRGLQIVNFGDDGIYLSGGSGNLIAGNHIGTNGVADLGNGEDGIVVDGSSGNTIGGTTAADRNVISGNDLSAIYVQNAAAGNVIRGNYIGTNSAGNAAIGNGTEGIYLDPGVSGTTIGGTAAGAGNVISGAQGGDGDGIQISGASNTLIQGNFIGTNAAGTASLGNGDDGIDIDTAATNITIGGTVAGAGNLISGNLGADSNGIRIDEANGVVIRGNLIGTDVTGTAALGNALAGIVSDYWGTGITIGGTAAGAGNTIAFNGTAGIVLTDGQDTAILRNSIHSNAGIGIDLEDDGATPNDPGDPDGGAGIANELQNFPTATSFGTNGTDLTVSGLTIDGAGNFRVEFFASPTNDGEGRRYVGSWNMTGGSTFNGTLVGYAVTPGEWVTMTATRSNALYTAFTDTSEFSAPSQAAGTGVSLSGTLYNDLNGNANVGDDGGAVFANATVRLYLDAGTLGTIDAGDTLQATTTTNASGAYTFGGLAAGDYYVVIDSRTLDAGLGAYIGAATLNDVWAEQTYAVAGAANNAAGTTFTGAAGALYGGRAAGSSDDASAITTAEHVTRVTIAGVNVAGIDSGFSYSAIVNTRGDAADDDGGATTRLQQGSLRQFILNSNVLAGEQTSNFSIGSGLQTIAFAVGGALPDIIDAVTLNATTQEGVFAVGAPRIELDGTGVGGDGLHLSANDSEVRGFAINRFGAAGIWSDGSGNLIAGNYLGLDLSGTLDFGNGSDGVVFVGGGTDNTVGGTAVADRNVISGNVDDGVSLDGSVRARVIGNYIGTNAAGTAVIGNDGDGVAVQFGATDNTVGGTTAGERNVISGNAAGGVGGLANVRIREAGTANNLVLGNFIGTDATGTVALANPADGVRIEGPATGTTVGGTAAGSGNVIGGHAGSGVHLTGDADNNRVQGNWIGTNSGGADLSNSQRGVWVEGGALASSSPTQIRIGGIGAGEPNTIAFNDGDGVLVSGAGTAYVLITANSIHSNGELGIDLVGGLEGASGVTPNDPVGTWGPTDHDPDTGPNKLQNHPSLSGAVWDGATLWVSGVLESTGGINYRIHVYASSANDPSGYGEGERYLGNFDVVNVNGQVIFTNQAVVPLAVVGAGDWITLTATAITGPDPGTSEFSFAARATGARAISGRISHDVNGDSALAGDSGESGVTVHLFRDGVDGLADGADDTWVATTTTDVNGDYSFTGLIDDTYWVVVDSKTFGGNANLWAEQTRGSAGALQGAGFLPGAGAVYGGRNATVSDNASNLPSDLDTAEHVTRVTVAGADVANVDSAFSYNVVVNVRGDGADDDELVTPGTARHSQGTLDQFILNANGIAGANAMRFVPAVAANQASGGDIWWRIGVTSLLPQITGADTTIDGTAYASTDGVTVLNTNTGSIGAGGTVGTGADGVAGNGDDTALAQVARPELEIRRTAAGPLVAGLDVNGANVTIADLSIWGFGNGAGQNADIVVRDVAGAIIQGNVIGTGAHDFTDPGAAARGQGFGVWVRDGNAGRVQGNLIGFHNWGGVLLEGPGNSPDDWQILANEIRANGWGNPVFDGIGLSNVGGTTTVQGNLVAANRSSGIDLSTATGTLAIAGNTITGNALAAGAEQFGIAIRGGTAATTIGRNVVTANTGTGVLVSGAASAQITQNSIAGNVGAPGLGIDLSGIAAVGDGVTANDLNDGDAGANNLQNFPVLTNANVSGPNIAIAGTLDSAVVGASFRLEFFASAAADASGHGEGERYLGFLDVTDGGMNDTDGVANGTIVFSTTLVPAQAVLGGEAVSATATALASGDTSEFAANHVANTAPVNTVPASVTATEDTAFAFAGANTISMADVQNNVVQVVLTVGNGTLSAAGPGTVAGSGTASVTITGTQADIDASLATLTYQGVLNYNGPDTLTVVTTDAGGMTDSDNCAITVNAVNDAPGASASASYNATEQTLLDLAGTLSIADVDALAGGITVTVSVVSGQINAGAGGTGAVVAGSGTASVTLTGTVAQINALLAGNAGATLAYFNGSDTPPASTTLTLSVNDNGNTGAGGVQVGSANATINIAAVNDAPTATAPASYAATEQVVLSLASPFLTVFDVDSLGAIETVTLSVVSGTLNATAGATGVGIAGGGTNTLTLTGTIAQLNNLLTGGGGSTLTYLINSDTPPATDTLTIAIDDGGNSGAGGALNGSANATINITALNDAPVNTVPATQATPEDTALVFSTANGNRVSIADADAGAALVDVTLTVTNGTLTLAGTAGLAFVAGADGTATMTVRGTIADINTAMDGMTYAPTLNYNGPATLTILTDDRGNTGTPGPRNDSDVVNIAVAATNDAPVNTVPPAQATNEDTALVFSAGTGNLVAIADADAGAAVVQVQLTVTNGTLTLAGVAGLAFMAGADGTATMTVQGTIAAVNAVMDGMTYAPTANYNGPATLTIATDDLGNTGAGGALADTDVVNVTVNAVNDGPVNAVPGPQTGNEDVPLALAGVAVNDVDGGPVEVALGVANGTLAVSLAGGATITAGANGTAALTLGGTQAQVNAALATLAYTGAANWSGTDTLTMTTGDLGNFGAGVPLGDLDTIALTINPVNDAPALGANAFVIREGGTLVLSSANLSATDVDDASGGLVFIVGGVANGHFALAADTAATITSFTQAQVLAGQVVFVHSGDTPTFTITVFDGGAAVGPQAANITFIGGGGTPSTPPGGGGSGGPGTTPVTPPAVPPVAPVVPPGLGTNLVTEFLRSPNGGGNGDGDAAVFAEAAAVLPTVQSASQAQRVAGAETLAPQVRAQSDLIDTTALRGEIEVEPVRAEMRILPTRHGLDLAEDDPERQQIEIVMNSVRLSGMALSVGAIWWAARAAGLVASLLASSPAWRHVDPLPVLGRNDEDEVGEWDDASADDKEKREEEHRAAWVLEGRSNY